MSQRSTDLDGIVRDYLAGMSGSEVCRKYHRGYETVRDALLLAGVDPGSHRQIARRQKIAPVSDVELAWLAGLLEGEAYFGSDDRRGTSYPMVGLNMTDEDVVRHAAEIMIRLSGTEATVIEKKVYAGKNGVFPKKQWRISIAGVPAMKIMKSIVHFMGLRRREAIAVIIEKGEKK